MGLFILVKPVLNLKIHKIVPYIYIHILWGPREAAQHKYTLCRTNSTHTYYGSSYT